MWSAMAFIWALVFLLSVAQCRLRHDVDSARRKLDLSPRHDNVRSPFLGLQSPASHVAGAACTPDQLGGRNDEPSPTSNEQQFSYTPSPTILPDPSMRKRGLAYNAASLTWPFSNSSQISWAYNWDSSPSGNLAPSLEYIPMLFNLNENATSVWPDRVSSALLSGSKHLFSFNEPDIDTQANLTASEAAAGHIAYLNQYSGRAELGSPAVTNGRGLLGLAWLADFFKECHGRCKIDFVNVHWYGAANDVSGFKSYIADAVSLGLDNDVHKLWLTEFRGNGPVDQQVQFLEEVLPWLDGEEGTVVGGYAWFMCAAGDGNLLISNWTESAIGQAYS
jgi:hypothetical protein